LSLFQHSVSHVRAAEIKLKQNNLVEFRLKFCFSFISVSFYMCERLYSSRNLYIGYIVVVVEYNHKAWHFVLPLGRARVFELQSSVTVGFLVVVERSAGHRSLVRFNIAVTASIVPTVSQSTVSRQSSVVGRCRPTGYSPA